MLLKKLSFTFSIVIIILFSVELFSISPAVKSDKDYRYTLSVLRNLRIMVENFPEGDIKNKYDGIKTLFQDASENFYGQNFTSSQLKYIKVKQELISLLEIVCQNYLDRTKEILDSTSKDTFDVLIEYSKESGLADYFRKPYDPLKDVKAYDPEKYHYFHDREKIEAYIRQGYKKYHRAKGIFNDPDIAHLKSKKNLPSMQMNIIIDAYMNVIFLCREAKQNGIEIHKIKNVNELGKILIKYDLTHGKVIPIYDDRIPEKYKVDANDNIMRIHSVELKRLEKNKNEKIN